MAVGDGQLLVVGALVDDAGARVAGVGGGEVAQLSVRRWHVRHAVGVEAVLVGELVAHAEEGERREVRRELGGEVAAQVRRLGEPPPFS